MVPACGGGGWYGGLPSRSGRAAWEDKRSSVKALSRGGSGLRMLLLMLVRW